LDSSVSPQRRLFSRKSNKPWNVRDHVPLEKFIIQSHRGAGELAPENTIEAFELGWKLGTYPEADVRTTKDGVIVAFHDNDFSPSRERHSRRDGKKGVVRCDFRGTEQTRCRFVAWGSIHRGVEFRPSPLFSSG
jgi:glycerophosphoryl diester phosphodiesterase